MMIKRVTSLILKFLFSAVAMTPCFFSNICNHHILYSFLNREKSPFLASLFKRGRYNLTYTNVCKHTLDKIKYVYTYYYFITSYFIILKWNLQSSQIIYVSLWSIRSFYSGPSRGFYDQGPSHKSFVFSLSVSPDLLICGL